MEVYIDDAGDPGVKFRNGSSTHLLMAAVVIPNEFEMAVISGKLHTLKRQLRRTREFKHNKMKEKHRELFFEVLEDTRFHVRTIIVDKRELTSEFLMEHKNEMKTFFIKQLLTHSYGQIRDARIVIDGDDLRAFGGLSTEYLYDHCNRRASIAQEVVCGTSDSSLGLQLADMVAGTVYSGLTRDNFAHNSDAWRQVRRRAYQPEGNWWVFKSGNKLQ